MRIPSHLQGAAKQLGLAGWVKDRDFPLKSWFVTIDAAKALLRGHPNVEGDDDSPGNDQVVAVLAAALDENGALLERVLHTTYPVSDPDAWRVAITAAGWVLLQRYDRAIKSGSWPES